MKQSIIWDELYSKRNRNRDLDKNVEWLKRYENYMSSEKENTCLDLGCGKGSASIYLNQHGYHVEACDFSSVALEQIKEMYPDICVNQFDMSEGIPYPDNSVGVIIASLSTHYFTMEQTKALYKEIYRCLKPGGYYIYRVNNVKEYIQNQGSVSRKLEENYYELKSGKRKRYFTVEDMAEILSDFEMIRNVEVEIEYGGELKYAIEGIARK